MSHTAKTLRLRPTRGDKPWMENGFLTYAKYEDDKFNLSLAPDLVSGEAIQQVDWDANGVTLTEESNDTSSFSVTVDGIGSATVTVQIQTGAKIRAFEKTFVFRRIDGRYVNTARNDYEIQQ